MRTWLNNPLILRARDYLRQHWRRALQLRERFAMREEALHLALAGVVGILGGLVNVAFFWD